jgi:hypothetical protein
MQVKGSKKIAKNAAFLGASNGIVKKSKKSVLGPKMAKKNEENGIRTRAVSH